MSDPGQTDPPDPEEFEVSVFGPGIGECVVVHLGANEWLVVDSCLDHEGHPVAERYLADLKVDLATAVRLVVVTHWHDDHIKGVSALFRKTLAAQLAIPTVFAWDEATLLVRMMREAEPSGSGIDELADLYAELIARKSAQARMPSPPLHALRNRTLLNGKGWTVTALSPSDAACQRAKIAFGEKVRELEGAVFARRLVSQGPNEASVVLSVASGQITALLGSDLEEAANPQDGWQVIVSDHATSGRAPGTIFKIPHHGSTNADCPDVWTKMLNHQVHAVLTPFRSSKLPRETDIERLKARTPHAFATADQKSRRAPGRTPAVDRTLKETAKPGSHLVLQKGRVGHVRMRVPLVGGDIRTDMFDGAFRL